MNSVSSDLTTLQFSHAFQLASLAILVYDYLLTFSEEIALMWRGRWGIASVLYLCTRVLGFIDSPLVFAIAFDSRAPPSQCHMYLVCAGWVWCIGVLVAQSILILRTYAICNWNRCLITALLMVHVGTNATVWTSNYWFVEGKPFILNKNGLSGCWLYIDPSNDRLWISYLLIFLNETVIVITTVFYIFRDGGYGYTPLIRTIRRDGIIFYVYLQALSILNILFIRFGPPNFHLIAVAQSFHKVLHGLLTARMLLNMRRAASTSPEGITYTSLGASIIEFGARGLSRSEKTSAASSSLTSVHDVTTK